jgi:hypothetical protein
LRADFRKELAVLVITGDLPLELVEWSFSANPCQVFLNSNGNPGVQDLYFLKDEYSTLATDIRHRVVGTATWNIPVGRGKRFGGNMPVWANEFVGGWELTTLADV